MRRGNNDTFPMLRGFNSSLQIEIEPDVQLQPTTRGRHSSGNNASMEDDDTATEAGGGRRPKPEHELEWRKRRGRSGISSLRAKCEELLNPHSKPSRALFKFFYVSFLIGIFLDPLFFFLLSIDEKHKCIVADYTLAVALTATKSIIDLVYILYVALKFIRAGKDKLSKEVVDGSAPSQSRYPAMWFAIDIAAALPFTQIMLWLTVYYLKAQPNNAAGVFRDLARVALLAQNIPRVLMIAKALFGQSSNRLVFETAWANFTLNLFVYVLVAHVVGSCWYLFGVQRVVTCLQHVCQNEVSTKLCDATYLDCGFGVPEVPYPNPREEWINSTSAYEECLMVDAQYAYGIYKPMGFQVAQSHPYHKKYIYSVYWGFLQISTLGGNLQPSLYPWEVLFTMGIGGLGLLMFASLIGSMQNFLQGLGRRNQEMQMRRRDLDNYMDRVQLPPELRDQVRRAERGKWVTTYGMEDEELLNGLPDDLRMKIKCHICQIRLKTVRLFTNMDPEARDAIFERLHERIYVTGCKIIQKGCPTKRMYFIVRGSLSFVDQNGLKETIRAGQFCGEELLLWHLDQNSDNSVSSRSESFWAVRENAVARHDIECLENVNALVLEGDDMAYIAKYFGRLLRTPGIRQILRSDSISYTLWERVWAAVHIQTAWRSSLERRRRRGPREARRTEAVHRRELQQQSIRYR